MPVGTTFVKQARAEARFTDNIPWAFGQGMVREDLEERVVEGLKAFAHLWFLEFSDETKLPTEFHQFVNLIDQWMLADTIDLEDDDPEEQA